ncbi:MAG: Na+/H+ antiporter NhaA, partial [Polyangiaceae bacterium]
TDIAFALGCITLVRNYVPKSIAVFLMALAIFDDLGAIVVITVFYGHGLEPVGIGLSVLVLGVLAAMNRAKIEAPVIYLVVGFVLWLAVLRSGIHPTLAGVLLGMCIPARPIAGSARAPIERLQAAFESPVSYLVVPLFALTNAGIDLHGLGFSRLASPVALGVVLGLCVGKGVGVFVFSSAAVRLRIAPPLEGALPRHLVGVSVLAGIGFTMSIFVAALSFDADSPLLLEAKLGILVASATSAAAGLLILRSGARSPARESHA